MTLLAIDTAGSSASVALFDGQRVVSDETWHAERHQDDELFGAIGRVLARASVTPRDLRFVACCSGPGSFTGLRVGIAAAQGIARAAGARVVGVSTLDVVAYPFRGRRRVCALVAAGRGERHAALYRTRDGTWQRVLGVLTLPIGDLAARVAGGALFAGEIDDVARAELTEHLGALATFPPRVAGPGRAGDLAELAWAEAEAGGSTAPEGIEPIYLRGAGVRGRSGELVA